MNRLTFKSHSKNGTEYYRYAHKWKRIGNTNISTSNKYSQITQKLGKLEDIEEELGIPLEVLFKALKDGIYVEFVSDEIRKCEVRFRKGFNTFVFEAVSLEKEKDGNRYEDVIVAKDYGFNWALTKEELENAKD